MYCYRWFSSLSCIYIFFSLSFHIFLSYIYILTLLEKYQTFFFENLVDFNEAPFNELTLIIHMHAWIFSRLSIVSVDGKQHLSEVLFSALIGFSLYGKWLNDLVSGLYPHTQEMLDSTNSDPNFMNTIITGDESWVYGYDPEPVIFFTMKNRWEH